jgi:hypothetical protein
MDTVGVSVPETKATGYLNDDPDDDDGGVAVDKPLVTVNGVDEATYTISTYDSCGNQMDGGGLADLVDAVLVVQPPPPDSRRLMDGTCFSFFRSFVFCRSKLGFFFCFLPCTYVCSYICIN